MNKRHKPTTTPALIEKAKACTSSKDVIRTLFGITRTPNGLDRAEAKKIFAKEGIPWPSARGRKGKGKGIQLRPPVVPPVTKGTEEEPAKVTDPAPPYRTVQEFVHCPSCGMAVIAGPGDRHCDGCGKTLTVEIEIIKRYKITAE